MTTKVLLSGLIAISILSGCASSGQLSSGTVSDSSQKTVVKSSTAFKRTSCKVLRVFDGDTLVCDLNGNGRQNNPKEKIRLLGIDTPESQHSKRYRGTKKEGIAEPLAAKATVFLRKATGNKTVFLEFDVKRKDRFGRTLAFVFTSEGEAVSVNEQLVANGLAKTFFIRPNNLYNKQLRQAANKARQKRLGLWH